MTPWKRYVDDTISYVKEEYIEHDLSKLNSYHDNIKFTYETEKDCKLPFSDVLIIRKVSGVETSGFKNGNSVVYISKGLCQY